MLEKLYSRSFYKKDENYFLVYVSNHTNIVFLLAENGPEKLDRLPKFAKIYHNILPDNIYKMAINFDLKKWAVKETFINLGD